MQGEDAAAAETAELEAIEAAMAEAADMREPLQEPGATGSSPARSALLVQLKRRCRGRPHLQPSHASRHTACVGLQPGSRLMSPSSPAGRPAAGARWACACTVTGGGDLADAAAGLCCLQQQTRDTLQAVVPGLQMLRLGQAEVTWLGQLPPHAQLLPASAACIAGAP